jgi:hypothetical protein
VSPGGEKKSTEGEAGFMVTDRNGSLVCGVRVGVKRCTQAFLLRICEMLASRTHWSQRIQQH